MRTKLLSLISVVAILSGCEQSEDINRQASNTVVAVTEAQPVYADPKAIPATAYLAANQVYNPEAPIPPQCYTKTEMKHNPCYVCHQSYRDEPLRPNKMNDGFQQGSYAFSDVGVENSWRNLFKDRSKEISKISDQQILEYISQDNYSPFIEKLKQQNWEGFIPELTNLHLGAAAFDQHGLAKDGSRWVAFNYKPMPSTFWPTNGSTDDVMIRLPDAFGELDGEFDKSVYYANLALVEMAIAETPVTTSLPIDESKLNIDLNDDGEIKGVVETIARRDHYIGDASDVALAHMLYPEGTAFLHTVRYVGVDDEGNITPSTRMKEVRYMVKKKFHSMQELKGRYYLERKEKHFEKLPYANDYGKDGVSNKHGWMLLGFIEDQQGQLRQQNHEEQFFCTGCHKSVGSIIDETFSFPRKVAGVKGWGYIDLRSMQDAPNVGEEKGEYLTYLQRVGGGDEFRQNAEMINRWFTQDGNVDEAKVGRAQNIYDLITPSASRALALNKAYRLIVEEQSFIYGRDAVLSPAKNVLESVDEGQAPLYPQHIHEWDIRLAWQNDSRANSQNTASTSAK